MQSLVHTAMRANSAPRFPYEAPKGSGYAHSVALRNFRAALKRSSFSFLRRFFSPGSHKWQNWHAGPCWHPVLCTKAHGLHWPEAWPADPTLGSSGEPGAGWLGGAGGVVTRPGARGTACPAATSMLQGLASEQLPAPGCGSSPTAQRGSSNSTGMRGAAPAADPCRLASNCPCCALRSKSGSTGAADGRPVSVPAGANVDC
mmetsp:Transcript_25127/g.77507  ORF Transcript_25127/g.77507 Transcript_25127/m.77507 type:complete len:202 (-) Transcript_25127:292-897(-)